MHPHVKLTMQRLQRESDLCRPVILSGTGGARLPEQDSAFVGIYTITAQPYAEDGRSRRRGVVAGRDRERRKRAGKRAMPVNAYKRLFRKRFAPSASGQTCGS